ncbi:MAG: hypothetical protein R2873_06135 [Caldilineaceae bacterium]
MSATTFPQNSADPKLDVTLPLGTHILQLVVRDDVGTESAPDTVVIHVMPQPPETMITHITPNEGAAATLSTLRSTAKGCATPMSSTCIRANTKTSEPTSTSAPAAPTKCCR